MNAVIKIEVVWDVIPSHLVNSHVPVNVVQYRLYRV